MINHLPLDLDRLYIPFDPVPERDIMSLTGMLENPDFVTFFTSESGKRLIILCHADNRGLFYSDEPLRMVSVYRELGYEVNILCCYPGRVKQNYQEIANLVIGDWECPTIGHWECSTLESKFYITLGE